tara:strand:+ start:56 stop:193 length:138 start_codon:yes stop_codon:yes gene_type:complete
MWTQDEALRIAQDHPTISLVLLVLALVGLEWIKSGKPEFLEKKRG